MCSILNSYKIVRKNITNIIILASLLFTGCSLAVPEPDEANQTLLIIPVESRQTLHKFVWVLHVSIEDSSSNEKHNHIIEPNNSNPNSNPISNTFVSELCSSCSTDWNW